MKHLYAAPAAPNNQKITSSGLEEAGFKPLTSGTVGRLASYYAMPHLSYVRVGFLYVDQMCFDNLTSSFDFFKII
jgi:hypothetical protein